MANDAGEWTNVAERCQTADVDVSDERSTEGTFRFVTSADIRQMDVLDDSQTKLTLPKRSRRAATGSLEARRRSVVDNGSALRRKMSASMPGRSSHCIPAVDSSPATDATLLRPLSALVLVRPQFTSGVDCAAMAARSTPTFSERSAEA